MNFNVSTLMQEPSGSARVYKVDERIELGDSPDAARVSGSVRLMKTDRGVWVSAGLDSEAPCQCVRCLEPYLQAIRMEIEEEYLPESEPDIWTSADGEDAEAPRIDEGQLLDMTAVIAQYIDLSLPMKPVCRTACKGLCGHCGSDLNVSVCGCDRLIDSRWAPLADMGSLVGRS